MDIGTAKPSAAQRARLPHHLVDIVEPSRQFNAGEFVKSAESLLVEIRGRGKTPVVCGGTAFYITSFLFGLPESPPGDPAVRERLRAMEREKGRRALYETLRARDPEAASRIPPADRYRILRALEILETTGKSVFSFRWPRAPRGDHRFHVIGLQRDRDELYRRIDARVDRMFADGLVEEVKQLLARGFGPGDPGMRGIGYREFLEMRAGCETIRQVRECIARNSRRYAKRQLTFFRSVPGVTWIDADDVEALRASIGSALGPAT